MLTILKKEVSTFFQSSIGYLVIGLFLLANSLFLWVFKTEFNILNAGFADLSAFFNLTPWVFIFIIPAITMKSFVDEYNLGTIEILKTKPFTNWEIIIGKFLGNSLIILFALLPTLIFVSSVSFLAFPEGNIDLGPIIGSYLGLLFIGFIFSSIGIFTSSISKTQIGAFVTALVICFILFFGFILIEETLGMTDGFLSSLSIQEYYKNIAKGVFDSRDIIFFMSITALFLGLTKLVIDEK